MTLFFFRPPVFPEKKLQCWFWQRCSFCKASCGGTYWIRNIGSKSEDFFFLSQFKTRSSLTCWSSVAAWQNHKLLYCSAFDTLLQWNITCLHHPIKTFVVWRPQPFMWIGHPRRLRALPLGVINVIFRWVTDYIPLMIQFRSCTSGVICIRDTVDGNQLPASPALPSSNLIDRHSPANVKQHTWVIGLKMSVAFLRMG